MSILNYNTQLQSNNTDLQAILDAVNELPDGHQAIPDIYVDEYNGIVHAIAGTKSSTYRLAFQPAKTIVPSVTSQIAVSSGYYTGGDIVVAGDTNLISANIRKGISIFGVNGAASIGYGTVVEDSIINRTVGYYENSNVKTIGDYAFAYCRSLTSVSFPACTKIGRDAFTNCYSLTSVSFPACTTIGDWAFSNCTSLTAASFPVCTSIGGFAFVHCDILASVSFPACTHINYSAFAYCYNLSQFYLAGSSVPTLSNSYAFYSTPYMGYKTYFSGMPYIYVPSSLITTYQSATNWVYFSSYFSAIEDAP